MANSIAVKHHRNDESYWHDYYRGGLNQYVNKWVVYRDGLFRAFGHTAEAALRAAIPNPSKSEDTGLVRKVVAQPYWVDIDGC